VLYTNPAKALGCGISRQGADAMNSFKSQTQYGQVRHNFLSRDFLAEGYLAKLIQRDRLTGVTSNPAIFQKAIDAGGSYLASLRSATDGPRPAHGDREPNAADRSEKTDG
jgi:hypothetical protein